MNDYHVDRCIACGGVGYTEDIGMDTGLQQLMVATRCEKCKGTGYVRIPVNTIPIRQTEVTNGAA